ncbi:hypothetical protein ACLX1H_010230 [Fusarium chlamydosporum]
MDNTSELICFEGLPTEIISCVFSQFCKHCTSHRPYTSKDEEQRIGIATLLALSMTSKRLRPLALTILFHQPSPGLNASYIVKMLDYEKDIGRNVKILELPIPGSSGNSNLAALKRIARRLLLDKGIYRQMRSDRESLATGLLLSLCPNVEWLAFRASDSKDREAPIKVFLNIHGKRQGFSKFTKLRILLLDTTICRTFSIAGCELALFLRQSPRLKTLILTGTKQDRVPDNSNALDMAQCGPALESITKFYIEQWMLHDGKSRYDGNSDRRTLKNILITARNLKSFTFSTGEFGSWGDPKVRSQSTILSSVSHSVP